MLGTPLSSPTSWVPTFTGSSIPGGYPIIGYTTLEIAQCYLDDTVATRMRSVISNLANHVWKKPIEDHQFVEVTPTILAAMQEAFVTGDENNLDINNPSVCGTGVSRIGRPHVVVNP